MFHRFLTAAFIASMLLLTSTAQAQDPGADEVTLKNGGAIRGIVISFEPEISVKILEMGEKEPRVIPWAQVSAVERGKYAPRSTGQPNPAESGQGEPAPSPPPAPEPKLGMPGVVKLHIDSPVRAELLEETGMAFGMSGRGAIAVVQFRPVCVSPCDTLIDGSKGQPFIVAGSFPSPDPVRLTGHAGDVTLTLKPGSTGLRTFGILGTAFGGISIVLGGILAPVLFPSSKSDSSKGAGIGMLVGGSALLGGGIAALVTSGSNWKLKQAGETPEPEWTRPYGIAPAMMIGSGAVLTLTGAALIPMGLNNISYAEFLCGSGAAFEKNCGSMVAHPPAAATQRSTGKNEVLAGGTLLGTGLAAIVGGAIWQGAFNKSKVLNATVAATRANVGFQVAPIIYSNAGGFNFSGIF